MLGVQKVRHVCLIAQDYKRMVEFYTDVLGFEIKSSSEYNSADLKSGLGIKDLEIQTALLTLPGYDFEMEITNYKGNDNPLLKLNVNSLGYRHIALIVEDIDKAFNIIKSLNMEYISEPVFIQRKDGKQLRFMYFRDPEGNFIELNQFIEKGV